MITLLVPPGATAGRRETVDEAEGHHLRVRRAGRDKLLISSPTFGMYAVCARVQGAGVVDVPLLSEDNFSLDVAAVLAAVDPCTRLVIVCSPNNPTGSLVAAEQLRALALGLQGRALMLVDEAYAEFADAPSAIAKRPLRNFVNRNCNSRFRTDRFLASDY